MHQISRRQFVGLGLGALAWACGKGKGSGTGPPASPGTGGLSVTQVSTEVAIGDKRFAFAMFEDDRTPFEPPSLKGASVQLRSPSGEKLAPITATVQQITLGQGGESDAKGAEVHRIFAFDHDFTTPGVWTMQAQVVDGGKRREGDLSFQVAESSSTVTVGQKAIAVESPTFDDHRGVDPICTRTPPCSMHDITIAKALEAGKPAVFSFATPKYCTSRTCGPVVDIAEAARQEVGDKASFVHIEVWKDEASVGKEPSPAFSAWKLEAEPWLFFVAADGTVRARWSGAIGSEETKQAVRDLVDGKL